jgi:hypothetical protein
MAKAPMNVVREQLKHYADRGIFRGFTETGNGAFKFAWLINQEMELNVDTTTHLLKFKRLLAGVSAGSALYSDLKSFVEHRHDPDLPAHRRIDRKRAEASCANRGGVVSVCLKVKNNQYAYGIKRIVNLVHELFLHLRQNYPDYLAENFDVPCE